jgi:hypothetical protein
MPDEDLGTWHDAETLRAAWPDLPGAVTNPGDIGADLVAASIAECVSHLETQELPVPEDDAVTANQRLAQLYFARSLWATRVTNEDAQATGLAGYEVPAYNFEAKARKRLGYGTLGIG